MKNCKTMSKEEKNKDYKLDQNKKRSTLFWIIIFFVTLALICLIVFFWCICKNRSSIPVSTTSSYYSLPSSRAASPESPFFDSSDTVFSGSIVSFLNPSTTGFLESEEFTLESFKEKMQEFKGSSYSLFNGFWNYSFCANEKNKFVQRKKDLFSSTIIYCEKVFSYLKKKYDFDCFALIEKLKEKEKQASSSSKIKSFKLMEKYKKIGTFEKEFATNEIISHFSGNLLEYNIYGINIHNILSSFVSVFFLRDLHLKNEVNQSLVKEEEKKEVFILVYKIFELFIILNAFERVYEKSGNHVQLENNDVFKRIIMRSLFDKNKFDHVFFENEILCVDGSILIYRKIFLESFFDIIGLKPRVILMINFKKNEDGEMKTENTSLKSFFFINGEDCLDIQDI